MLSRDRQGSVWQGKKAFTPATLDGHFCVHIFDPETPGLSIQMLPSGRKSWHFRRRLPGSGAVIKARFGFYPARSIADAREWARSLNEQVEAGNDPRQARREEEARTSMTVDRAHELYMVGRAGRPLVACETAQQASDRQGQA